MTLYRSIGAALETGGTIGTEPIDVRKDLMGVFTGTGVLPGGPATLVTGTAGFAYQVGGPVQWVTSRGASDGYHLWGNDGAITVATGVAPGADLSRIDIIWVRHPSNGENADTTSEPELGVTQGTAAASPIAPAIPTGALEIARNTMTSSATTTASAGNTITQTATVARVRGQQEPGKSVRVAGTTLGISAWGVATDPLAYSFEAGGWYLINATGSVSIGGSAAELTHRVRAAGLDVSAAWPVTAAPSTIYSLSGHLLFQASLTATVQVMHEVFVPDPATGIVVRAGHTVSVVRVA